MPAPENLAVQTPGEQLAAAAVEPAPEAPPVYSPKHNGGGRWVVIDADGEKAGEFVGASKEAAQVEADRLNDGGELQSNAVAAEPAARAKPAAASLDPTTLKAAVMTSEGWLCPEQKGA